jgi:hypothetical protein
MEKEILKYEIKTRVNEARFSQLTKMLESSECQNMSELVRHILNNRPVTLLHRDKSLDLLIEELTSIRKELRSIGININQITRQFNTYPEKEQKIFYALGVSEQYQLVGKKVDQLLNTISKLSEQWLPK